MQRIIFILNFALVISQIPSMAADDVFPVEFDCEEENKCICVRTNGIETFNVQQVLDFIQFGESRDKGFLACCYHQLAVEFHNSDLFKAIEYNELAKDIRSINTDGLLWKSFLNLGLAFFELQEYKQASKNLQQSLYTAGFKKPKDSIRILRNLSDCNFRLGDLDKALEYGEQAIQVRAINRRKGIAFGTMADILNETKDLVKVVKAISYADKAVKLSTEARDFNNVCNSLISKGNSYEILGKYEQSISQYQKVLNYADSLISKDTYIAKAINNIATVLFEQKEYHLAIEKLLQSLDLKYQNKEVPFSFQYASNHENLADNYTALHQFDTALLHYQKALINLTNNFRTEDIFQNPNSKDTTLFIYSNPDMIRVLHLKATTAHQYYQQNNNQKYLTLANQTYQTAFDFHDQLQKDISTENSRLFQAKNIVPYIENALKVAYELQENGQDISESAFRFMEKNKATVLLQSMNEADALQFANLPDSLVEQEKDLKIALTYHNKQLNELTASAENKQEIDRLTNVLFDEKQQYQQLITDLENNYPDYYRLKYQQNQTQLNEVQQSLDNQTAILEYFVGEEVIYLLLISTDHTHLYRVNKPDNWNQTIQHLRQSITNVYQAEKALFTTNARQLSRLLVDPVLCDLSTAIKRLQIIPDAELNYVPFEVLLTADTDKTNIQYKNLNYLLKEKSIAYTYSAALWLETRETHDPLFNQPKTSYGGYAPRYNNQTYSDLPIARETVKVLANALSGQSYINEEAVISNFLNDQNHYNMLHLATHGVLNDENPLNSYMAFSPAENYKLYAYDLYNMKINSDLTILHACNTGSGELQKGEGVMSLSRAFTYAGCPSLVMSLWQIPEESTSEITKLFIEYLQNGLTKDVALQQAKLAYLDSAKQTLDTPAFWAGLVATGNLEAMDFQQ